MGPSRPVPCRTHIDPWPFVHARTIYLSCAHTRMSALIACEIPFLLACQDHPCMGCFCGQPNQAQSLDSDRPLTYRYPKNTCFTEVICIVICLCIHVASFANLQALSVVPLAGVPMQVKEGSICMLVRRGSSLALSLCPAQPLDSKPSVPREWGVHNAVVPGDTID